MCNIHHIHLEDLLTKPGAKAESAASIQFTDEQMEDLKAALVPVVREDVRDAGDGKGKNRRPHGMVR